MLLLFVGSGLALFIAVIIGEGFARGRGSMVHELIHQSKSATAGLVILAAVPLAFSLAIWLLLGVAQLLFGLL